MYDSPTSWRDTVRAGDIVAFAFPSSERDPLVEKQRPCLVLRVTQDGPETDVLLAYGTAARTRANAGLEIRVMQPADIRACSLDRATRFVGSRTARATLDSPRFAAGPCGTPVIGRLPGSLEPRLARILQIGEGHLPRCALRRRRPTTCIDLREEVLSAGMPANPVAADRLPPHDALPR